MRLIIRFVKDETAATAASIAALSLLRRELYGLSATDAWRMAAVDDVPEICRVRSLVGGHFQNSAGGLNVEDYLTPAAIEGPRGGMSAETRR